MCSCVWLPQSLSFCFLFTEEYSVTGQFTVCLPSMPEDAGQFNYYVKCCSACSFVHDVYTLGVYLGTELLD